MALTFGDGSTMSSPDSGLSILRATSRVEVCHAKSEKLPGRFGRPAQLLVQPGACVGPVAVGRPHRDPQRCRGLLDRQSGEVPQLNDSGNPFVLRGESRQSLVEGEKVVAGRKLGDVEAVEVKPLSLAAV